MYGRAKVSDHSLPAEARRRRPNVLRLSASREGNGSGYLSVFKGHRGPRLAGQHLRPVRRSVPRGGSRWSLWRWDIPVPRTRNTSRSATAGIPAKRSSCIFKDKEALARGFQLGIALVAGGKIGGGARRSVPPPSIGSTRDGKAVVVGINPCRPDKGPTGDIRPRRPGRHSRWDGRRAGEGSQIGRCQVDLQWTSSRLYESDALAGPMDRPSRCLLKDRASGETAAVAVSIRDRAQRPCALESGWPGLRT